MSSILTNNGAMTALQTLKSINSNMSKTQAEISTGKSVATAKDNAAVWAISKVMESDVKGFKEISNSLALGESTVAVGRQAAESVTDLLTDMKGKIVAAQEQNVDRSKLQTDIEALRDQIKSVVGAAQFNGLNLVDGKSSEDVKVLSSLDRGSDGSVKSSSINVARQNLAVEGTVSNATFGGTAATAGTYLAGNNGGTAYASDAAADATVATGTAFTTSITSVANGVGYEIALSDVALKTADGGTATGARTFQYVANASDSAEDVAKNLKTQIQAYFDASTDSGKYSVTVENGVDVTITNNSGGDSTANIAETTGGTAGTPDSAAGLGALLSIDVTDDAGAGAALSAIDGLIEKATNAAAAFGSAQGRIETQSDFVGKLSDSLKSGIGALVDADMEAVSARLQALQTQQQLGVQSLSIANQAPQSILSLFR